MCVCFRSHKKAKQKEKFFDIKILHFVLVGKIIKIKIKKSTEFKNLIMNC